MNAQGMFAGLCAALALAFCWGQMCDGFWMWFLIGLAMAPGFGLMFSQAFADDDD